MKLHLFHCLFSLCFHVTIHLVPPWSFKQLFLPYSHTQRGSLFQSAKLDYNLQRIQTVQEKNTAQERLGNVGNVLASGQPSETRKPHRDVGHTLSHLQSSGQYSVFQAWISAREKRRMYVKGTSWTKDPQVSSSASMIVPLRSLKSLFKLIKEELN